MQEGAKLAQTPPKHVSHFEQLRANRVARAALETPLVSGMRLMPEYTPGRALLWGSIIALWGSGAIFLTAAKGLDIHAVRSRASSMFGIKCERNRSLHTPGSASASGSFVGLSMNTSQVWSADVHGLCRLKKRSQSLEPLLGQCRRRSRQQSFHFGTCFQQSMLASTYQTI